MLSRRMFLASSSAVAVAHLLPTLQAAGAPIAAVSKPATTIWVGGHNGEFDWQAFHAESEEDAIAQLFRYHGRDMDMDGQPYTLKDADLAIQRVHKMDGLQPDEIKSHHWIRAGLGSHCERCDGECCAEDGACVISGEVVCEECQTLTDLIKMGGKYDIDLAEERLIEMFLDNDCDEGCVFKMLSDDNDMTVITPAFWVKCLGEARRYS